MRLIRQLVAFAVLLACAASAFGQGYVCAEGGGTGSGPWAMEMFRWMVEKGKGGSVVILGAVELDAPDKPDEREELFRKAGASGVSSLVVTGENADSPEVYDAIAAASIVFIRGGSQSRYVEMWKGTRTEHAIRSVFAKGGVVGGTSAGCAVLGEVTYDARHGSLRPEEAIRDARHPDLTLTKGFLGLVPGVLFDTHFNERARLPRLALMLAHCREDLQLEPLGIGLDPRTALCISPDGTAEVKGEGYATFLELMLGTRTVLERGQPPVVTSVLMTVVAKGKTFDLTRREFTTPRASAHREVWQFPMRTLKIGGDRIPTEQLSEDERDDLGEVNWINLAARINDPGVYCKVNSYARAKETMTEVLSWICYVRPSRVLMMSSGVEASAEGSSIEFLAQKQHAATSGVVIDIGCVQEAFGGQRTDPAQPLGKSPGSVYRAKLHLLPPGWRIDFADGVPMRAQPEGTQGGSQGLERSKAPTGESPASQR